MLAAHLSRLAQRRPARYAAPDPLSPLSLLVRSRLLSQPMQGHESQLPSWDQSATFGHLPGLLDAIHSGHHDQFPALLDALHQYHQELLPHFHNGAQPMPFSQPGILQALRHLYEKRAGLPGYHPLIDAYTHGSLGDLQGNQAGAGHMLEALRRPTTTRAMEGLTSTDRMHLRPLLESLATAHQSNLPGLLRAHAHIRNMLLPHGASGPFSKIAPLTSGAIAANVRGREEFGHAHEAAISPRHDRPGQMLPEDYYALSRKNPRRL